MNLSEICRLIIAIEHRDREMAGALIIFLASAGSNCGDRGLSTAVSVSKWWRVFSPEGKTWKRHSAGRCAIDRFRRDDQPVTVPPIGSF